MDFLSYGKQWIDNEDITEVEKVLKSPFLTQGPKVTEFEKALCNYTGANYCVVVSNGTAALHLAVAALDIEKNKKGITSPITFAASSNCMIYNNVNPLFVDINPKTYNLDYSKLEEIDDPEVKLIIPVHFAGQPCNMDQITKIANNKNWFIIEDASHAIGSKYKDGSMVGSNKYSDMTTFSFHPVKTITTGEGGAITTNDKELYKKLIILRNHGITKNKLEHNTNPETWYYEMQKLGFNYRLTDIQCALGISQLKKLNMFIKRRREIVKKYNNDFKDEKFITIPFEERGYCSAFHLYVLQFDFSKLNKNRNEMMNILKKKNIGTQVHYIPVHIHPYYQKKFGFKLGDFPCAEKYYEQALSIPLYPKMNNEEVQYVIDNILSLVSK
ncbi:MAG: UDP-4-amino-4,6-dideoxy-N-acetyl-beta-L-altrosamine transaminase [Spirochaetes bacterium]|nr:UDP-4-amino-4,6-dideoxy-N-acetyl-beta-L-altrosamine transaminase [Spirochaetota bacterium]